MSGAGKWIKKHPLQAVGLLAGAAVGGPALAGLFGAGAGAGVPVGAGVLGGTAEGGGGALAGFSGLAEMPVAGGGIAGAFDKLSPYAKLAGQAEGLLSPDQQQMPAPMAQRPQMVAQGGGMGGLLPYGDPAEEEKWRRMQQSGRFYG